jgi:hypothetical protein
MFAPLRRELAAALEPPVDWAKAERLQKELAERARAYTRGNARLATALDLLCGPEPEPCPFFCENGIAFYYQEANSAGRVIDVYGPCPVCADPDEPRDAWTAYLDELARRRAEATATPAEMLAALPEIDARDIA